MKCPFCIKVCSKCKRILVANAMNFYKKERGKYGVRADCKKCFNEKTMKKEKENPEKYKEYHKKASKKWRENNKERCQENTKRWRKENYDRVRENSNRRNRKYKKAHPEKVFNDSIKRRQSEKNQGNGITKDQWLEMMEFFDWRCAYSGEYVGNNDNRTIDHIIPLSRSGEHEIWNCVPMVRNYNCSKQSSDMLEWYTQQPFYSEERLNKIYEWIEYAKNKYQNN